MTHITLTLPKPHSGQLPVYQSRARYRVVPCGRRFGKTTLDQILLAETMLDRQPTAYYAPTYKQLAFVWRDVKSLLASVIRDKSETEHRIELITGGSLDMWSLETDRPGVGRKYKRVVVDEAGMCPNLEEAWTEAIRPTLTDLSGDAIFSGTPKGRNFFWTLFCYGNDPLYPDWQSWQLPTTANPYIDPAEVEAARLMLPERAFLQEYMADFIEESGGVFRRVREAVDAGRVEPQARDTRRYYYLGVDLARVEDFTVLSVVDDLGRQVYHERFNQISWDRQITAICEVAERYEASVLVDSTGVGDPIFEALERRGVDVDGYNLTAGSKERLIDNLALLIERGDIRLMDIEAQTNELLSYQYEVTAAHNVRMCAPNGIHDDCVISLAMAAWFIRYEEHPRIVVKQEARSPRDPSWPDDDVEQDGGYYLDDTRF